jgi:hypothetical protein
MHTHFRLDPSPTPDSSFNATTLAEAFHAVRAEAAAIPEAFIVRMNMNVPRATQIGFGAAERIDELLPMMEQLSFFDPTPVRKVRTYAAAALHAHLVANNPNPGQNKNLPAMIAECRELRTNLLVGVQALAHFGLVSADRVAEIRRSNGHLAKAGDLSALAVLMEDAWSEVKDKVPVTRAMVERAGELGLALQIALGIRAVERGTVSKSEARDIRARTFALFARAYDACRRGVTFLRWNEGDVDWYVPSLYGNRVRRPATRRRSPVAVAQPVAAAFAVSEAEAAE